MVSHAARPTGPFLVVIALVAFNLRTALTPVPTVLAEIADATGANAVMLGALTALPVLCMGLLAIAVPSLAARYGSTRMVWAALAILVIALALRLVARVPGVLPASAVLAGMGIALASGLVPAVIRAQLPTRIGAATGIWTGAMFIGAALGASLTVPMAEVTGSWEAALALWAVPAVVGLIAWTAYERPFRTPPQGAMRLRIRDLPWLDPVALALTAWFALNSVVFYAALAWLAPAFTDRGLTPSQSGLVFGLFTAVQIAGAFVTPPLLHRSMHPRALLLVIALSAPPVLLAIAYASTPVAIAAMVVFGLSLSSSFTGGLALIPMSSPDAQVASQLTAVVFTVTYVAASIGPLAGGAIVDATGSYAALFTLLAVICAAQALSVPRLRKGAMVRGTTT